MSAPAAAAPETTVIRDVAPGLTILSVPFIRSGLIKLGGAATVIKLRSTGALAVVSPVALTDGVRAELSSLGGDVKYLIAPNTDHHMHLSAWASAFPSAQIIVPDGLPQKREKDASTAGTAYGTVFTSTSPVPSSISPEFDADLAVEYLPASKLHEIVLLHKPTGTLIEGDLLFNLPAKEAFSASGVDASSGIATKLAAAVLQTASPSWQQKALWHGTGAADRGKLSESLRRIQAWEFDRIIPCHGDVVETGGKKVFEDVVGPFLKA